MSHHRSRSLIVGLVLGSILLSSTIAALSADRRGFALRVDASRPDVEPMIIEASGAGHYEILPILSAGMEVPLLRGSFPLLVPDSQLTYMIPGIPDGMGVIEGDVVNWLILQHEYDGDPSDAEDFQKTVFSRTISGFVPGARISLVMLTKDWRVIGAKPLIREFAPTLTLKNEDGSPRVAPGSRIAVDVDARRYVHEGHIPSAFCSGTLATTGFVDPRTGKEAPVWFASEEDDGYSGLSWAVFTDGLALPLEGLGVSEKEQTLPLSSHRPAKNGTTIIVATDDETDGEVYLWIGQPTEADPNGFTTGSLYAMKIAGAARESGPAKWDGVNWEGPDRAVDIGSTVGDIGDAKRVTWTLVPPEARVTGESLADFVTGTDANGATNATSFLYPEDLDEDPRVPGRLYLAANGGADSVEWDGEEERYENPFARLYQIDLGIVDPKDPSSWNSSITYLLEGGPGAGMSYDNLVADTAGKVLLSEDLNQGIDEADAVWATLAAEQRAPGIYEFDVASGETRLLFALNQFFHDPQLDWERVNALVAADEEEEARDQDLWEGSGMIEVPSESRGSAPAYLIGVQAHSVSPSGVVEGGQVLLVRPR